MIAYNIRAVSGQIRKITRKIREAAIEGLIDAGQKIMKESQKLAPYRDCTGGNLRSSAYVAWADPTSGEEGNVTGGEFGDDPFKKKQDTAGLREQERESMLMEASERLFALKGRNAKVEIGYSAAYAMVTHENPRAGKTYGKSPKGRKYPEGSYATKGQWKFLETAFLRNEGRVLSIIAKGGKNPTYE